MTSGPGDLFEFLERVCKEQDAEGGFLVIFKRDGTAPYDARGTADVMEALPRILLSSALQIRREYQEERKAETN
jgi:hypothetical protein